VIGEALEELVREVDVELADRRPRKRHLPHEAGPSGQIDDDPR
jgi:hypothetical protein